MMLVLIAALGEAMHPSAGLAAHLESVQSIA
jgi:hypothetical protein